MDVYEIITNRIVESLEKGTVPWQCPWQRGKYGQPRNFVSTKPYRGINVFLLGYTSHMKGYQSPFWVSYKQAQQLGGNVRQGEKSASPVVFYSEIEKKEPNADGEKETFAMLRYTPMFNTDQCEGLNVPDLSGGVKLTEHQIIESAQAIIDNMPNRPELNIRRSNRAYYSPDADSVTAPELAQYEIAEQYYSTVFHELGHSTGHKSRLDRDLKSTHFADHTYSKEELVAEFTSSYLCGIAGIEQRTLLNSASYIDAWLTILKDKKQKKWISWAAGQAQKAADYIQGINVESMRNAA
jgi:Antirestriction protein